jgi:hypothetical protein
VTNDPRVPAHIRASASRFGLASDEFTSTDGWPPELYVREARRMVSDYVTSEQDCVGGRSAPDPIAVASYKIDSHACRRIVVDGVVTDEGIISHGVPRPYGISLGSVLPRASQCTNLVVSACIGSSHVAWSSLRMEPVFMMLGHAAGTIAALGVDAKSELQAISYDQIQAVLRSSHLDVDPPKTS